MRKPSYCKEWSYRFVRYVYIECERQLCSKLVDHMSIDWVVQVYPLSKLTPEYLTILFHLTTLALTEILPGEVFWFFLWCKLLRIWLGWCGVFSSRTIVRLLENVDECDLGRMGWSDPRRSRQCHRHTFVTSMSGMLKCRG